MSIALIVIGFVASGLIFGLFATATAPMGYEDESGFHFGPEKSGSKTRRAHQPEREVAGHAHLSPTTV